MSLSDCPKCLDTPCICGEAYKHLSPQVLTELASRLIQIAHMTQKPEENPRSAVEEELHYMKGHSSTGQPGHFHFWFSDTKQEITVRGSGILSAISLATKERPDAQFINIYERPESEPGTRYAVGWFVVPNAGN